MALYAFDGTWNDANRGEDSKKRRFYTNVHYFSEFYESGNNGGKIFYLPGPGTRKGFLGKVVGGFAGAGAEDRVRDQITNLRNQFKNGDEIIDIIGYSRGAAIARLFLQELGRVYAGITNKDGELLKEAPQVRFLGLFDTVASFSIPWNQDEGEFTWDIPDFVENTFHAMALDETRETFGLERCRGNRETITEVWFRGSHGDVGGNGSLKDEKGNYIRNKARSDVPLKWMIKKASACGIDIKFASDSIDEQAPAAQVTASDDPIRIGNVGTLSRRIHLWDLVHHTVEDTELKRNIKGGQLRNISIPTRIEDRKTSERRLPTSWYIPEAAFNFGVHPKESITVPTLEDWSSRGYPFVCPPARRWQAWLEIWELPVSKEGQIVSSEDLDQYWAPTEQDKALAWDIYVELVTRIATQKLEDGTGINGSAIDSIVNLFGHTREAMKKHGCRSSNTATLIVGYLNTYIRPQTSKWHRDRQRWNSIENGELEIDDKKEEQVFRTELKETQRRLTQLASCLEFVTGTAVSGWRNQAVQSDQ